jgi:hypothetical protein
MKIRAKLLLPLNFYVSLRYVDICSDISGTLFFSKSQTMV